MDELKTDRNDQRKMDIRDKARRMGRPEHLRPDSNSRTAAARAPLPDPACRLRAALCDQ